MFGLGTTELIIILVILVMVFGLGKLPQAANKLGEAVGEFRSGVDGDDEVEIGDADYEDPAQLEDKETAQSVRDASVPSREETGERSPDGGTL